MAVSIGNLALVPSSSPRLMMVLWETPTLGADAVSPGVVNIVVYGLAPG
jgi:hypothetical protein